MSTANIITLHLTARGIDGYCHELARRAPNVEKRVAALDTLITFISAQADAGEQAKGEFAAIKHSLLVHFEQARETLLAERAQQLQAALQARQLPQLTAVYNSLSRDAFWTLLGRVEQQLDAAAVAALRRWAVEWMIGAKQRAQQTSPYPDAIDFTAAGIDATEYLVMTDLCRALGVGVALPS